MNFNAKFLRKTTYHKLILVIPDKNDGSLARNVLSSNDFDLAEEYPENKVEEPFPKPVQVHDFKKTEREPLVGRLTGAWARVAAPQTESETQKKSFSLFLVFCPPKFGFVQASNERVEKKMSSYTAPTTMERITTGGALKRNIFMAIGSSVALWCMFKITASASGSFSPRHDPPHR
jgi:hypothetical protein